VDESTTSTLTFVFTDIEGSTHLLRALGDGYRSVLREHDRVIADATEAHGGEVFGSEGDAQCLVFADPGAAARAAIESQQQLGVHPWPEGHPVRVRMGIHSGEAERDASGFVAVVRRGGRPKPRGGRGAGPRGRAGRLTRTAVAISRDRPCPRDRSYAWTGR
jgi:hypothetical protein